jgi:DNA-binding transcriptional regulator YiaG
MDIREFLSKAKEDEVATAIGVSVHTVRKWRTGDRTPRPEHAYKLIDWSHGVLSLHDIYKPDQHAA